jgi:hypothetical protein
MGVAAAGIAAMALLLGACGGDDDDTADDTSTESSLSSSSSTSSTLATTPPITLPVETAPPTPTTPTYNTEGASVMVANASRVDGGAGRLSDRLAAVGFSMVAAGNSTEGPLDTTKIYFDAANPAAQAVAESIKVALGGGAIEVLAVPTPPPIESGDLAGAGVLVAMGNDTADKTLEELQGITTTTTTTVAGSGSADSGAPSSTTA